MTGAQLKAVRERLKLTQQEAAARWKVSQPYLSLMEHGRRSVPVGLARLLTRHETGLAAGLPLESLRATADELPRLLGSLGYSGFAYLATPNDVANPASVLFSALCLPHMPARVVEALPWLMVSFPELDWNWLLDRAKLANLQNRLGYLVVLARRVAERQSDFALATRLLDVEHRLEEARLAKEDTLGRALTEVERRHLREHRPSEAVHWNVLTGLRLEDLRYDR